MIHNSLLSATTDVFAIARICYEALADAPPILPHPKLPGEWDKSLSSWDAALDAGLRARPERRPQTSVEWAGLLPLQQPLFQKTEFRQVNETKQSLPCARKHCLAWFCGAVVLVICSVFLVKNRSSIFTKLPVPAFSNFSRGVADSVIKYGSTSYDGAKWHEVYNVNKLLPDRVRLTGVFGWNRENFSVIADGGRGNLLIRCKADKWSTMTVPGFTGFGQGLKPGRYLSLERLLLLNQKNSSECDLIVVTGDSYQVLGETHWATSLVPLADDLWYGFSRLGYVWRYNGTKVEDLERSSRDYYVRTKDNLVAQCHGQNMELGYVKSVTVLSPGRAVGLWSHPFGFAGIVTYHEGKWQLEQEVPMNGSPKSAWFLDEKNLVAIGGDKLVRILAGKPEFQVLSISGHEYPSKALTHVWGKSMYDYCVADKRGNILNFNGDTWRLVIRGPNEADDRENFQVAWVSPEGAVFAFTEKAVYCLE